MMPRLVLILFELSDSPHQPSHKSLRSWVLNLKMSVGSSKRVLPNVTRFFIVVKLSIMILPRNWDLGDDWWVVTTSGIYPVKDLKQKPKTITYWSFSLVYFESHVRPGISKLHALVSWYCLIVMLSDMEADIPKSRPTDAKTNTVV